MTQWAYTPSFNYTVSTTLAIYCTQTDRLPQWAHTSSFMTQWAYTPSFTYRVSTTLAIYCTYTVQPQFLPYLQSGPMPPHSMTQWAYTPFTYPVGTTLAIYCTQTVQPHFLSYLHSGPIPPHFMQQWAYTPIYLYRVHHQSRLLYTNCPASFSPLLAQWFHTSSFFDTVGLYPPFSYTVGKGK